MQGGGGGLLFTVIVCNIRIFFSGRELANGSLITMLGDIDVLLIIFRGMSKK